MNQIINKVMLFLLFPVSGFCQIQNHKVYSYKKPPSDSSVLCATLYEFLDSTGYWSTGCEDHNWRIGKFVYTADSNILTVDFVPYQMFDPLLSLKKKYIPGKKDIAIIVYDFSGRPCSASIDIIKIGRKRDSIIHTYYNNNFGKPVVIPRSKNKKTFWTIAGLNPIFFTEIHIPFEEKYNYYTLQIDLPCSFTTVTDSKTWVVGKIVFKILNNRQIQIGEDIYECD